MDGQLSRLNALFDLVEEVPLEVAPEKELDANWIILAESAASDESLGAAGTDSGDELQNGRDSLEPEIEFDETFLAVLPEQLIV